jgi:hypothetical protein
MSSFKDRKGLPGDLCVSAVKRFTCESQIQLFKETYIQWKHHGEKEHKDEEPKNFQQICIQ